MRARFLGHGPHRVGHDGWWWLHEIAWLLILVAVAIAAVLVVRHLLQRQALRPQPMVRLPALEELDLRYARGEVAREDYLQRRADLLGAAGYGPPPAAQGPVIEPKGGDA